jgi:hypothetical protein
MNISTTSDLAVAAGDTLTDYPSSDRGSVLVTLVLPDPQLIFARIVPAIAIGIIGLVQGAGVSQTFPNPDGKYSRYGSMKSPISWRQQLDIYP